jgi:hypothetical protein
MAHQTCFRTGSHRRPDEEAAPAAVKGQALATSRQVTHTEPSTITEEHFRHCWPGGQSGANDPEGNAGARVDKWDGETGRVSVHVAPLARGMRQSEQNHGRERDGNICRREGAPEGLLPCSGVVVRYDLGLDAWRIACAVTPITGRAARSLHLPSEPPHSREADMYRVTRRPFGSFTRAGVFLSLTGAILALMPRPASALALICNSAGQCLTLGNSCEFWSAPTEYICFTLGPIALKDPSLFRDEAGGASLVNDGERTPIMGDAGETILTRWTERRRKEGTEKPVTEALRREFEAAFRSTDRRVSNQRLERISRELGVRIETNPGEGGGVNSPGPAERVDLSEVSRANQEVSRFLAQPKLAEVLTNLRSDKQAAEEASRNPRGYLTERGVQVPRSIDLRFGPPTAGGAASKVAVEVTVSWPPAKVKVIITF